MQTLQMVIHQPNWQAEDPQGAGRWCYAAVTRAVRGTLLGEVLPQQEIAHDFYLRANRDQQTAFLPPTTSTAITNYCGALGLEPGDEPIPLATVQGWISAEWPDPTHYLRAAWGMVNLDGLTQDDLHGAQANEATELAICKSIDSGGLVVVGTGMHYLLVYGYELDVDDDDQVLARRFMTWDPADGSTDTPYLDQINGLNQLTFVTS